MHDGSNDAGEDRKPDFPGIFLVGYRGSGKSVVGRELAELLGRPLVDTDERVVARAGVSIAEIFAQEGEAVFRKAESEALAEVVQRIDAGERLVVATGGGMVLAPSNVRALRGAGIVVWLDADVTTLRGRIGTDPASAASRPSLSGQSSVDEVEAVLEVRRPLYERSSHVRLATDSASPQELAQSIVSRLNTLRRGPR